MSDKFNIDSHKLSLHPIRVSRWLEAKDDWERLKKIYPVYVEISPYGGCNHRCTFCALDYMGYENVGLEFDTLKNTLTNMAQNGVKSVMFAGEGEPLLFKDLDLIVEHCKKVGIDTSLTTNFVPLNKKNIEKCIENCSWIKVSLNAGTAKSYAEIHRTKEMDFKRVTDNLKYALEYRRANNLTCTIGVQMLLLPENKDEAKILALTCKEMGVDYLVIKPYSQHLSSKTHKYEDIDYATMLHLEEELNAISDENFNVVFRANTMKKYVEKKQPYTTCHSTPFFWGYIAADGKVFGCSAYLGKDEFCYGNIYENSFSQIWEGDKRRVSYNYVQNELDIKNCRVNCRMDEVNRYLWRLKNPQEHDNFI
ncbi:MAG: radical SAM protein [Sulfurimonas sp. RIFOXYD12_FULL_33_39]|uniref:radical SAM protein n=1 Tax=unclassified Sulfurimonas TaxID=2623549 RepID=UPI0008C39872|nr:MULTISPECIES: radical SAM protein [unclassified Sulfurimonas]OHE04709.1 MAG: radical SAM protein [Sulfurimonas sp. RIFCSPLOWO2_12_FULL_34_6]OHE10307.1 MAG: radical SAM protein [Sulfurimonas sp. RIFOXYD12_FULL_33_39]OHE13117.1 MAG: radical SAM protein [Sulfurimonas sp. RIFOXYD2_FULL_34_21]DAB28744.1 MAG TPA: radical SAM protein [Sulfurimonas sp. UBA10385]